MSKKSEEGATTKNKERKQKRKIVSTFFDIGFKTLLGFTAVYATIIAGKYESKNTYLTVQSQREQAESQLRATMFSNLISPITGPKKDGTEIEPKREKLLVELLALNFHENFEFKPLLEFVDKRLADDEAGRKSLRSIARRVSDRQIASLLKEGKGVDTTWSPRRWYNTFFKKQVDDNGADIQPLEFIETTQKNELNENYINSLKASQRGAPLNEFLRRESPDKSWNLDIRVTAIDSKEGTVTVGIIFKRNVKDFDDLPYKEFTLTAFDFPLTDNTLLADGNRFAIVLDKIDYNKDLEMKTARLRLIWFPKNYFTLRERPINYNEVREKLGIKVNE
jgi:hypothetical protein